MGDEIPVGAPHDPDAKFTKGGAKDISGGPVKARRCTDICCVVLFLLHIIGFAIITFLGMQSGNPANLYKPRDFRGGYCGLTGLESAHKLLYTMNVSQTAGQAAFQLVCSSYSQKFLASQMSSQNYSSYLCACCAVPCGSCSLASGLQDLPSWSAVNSTVTARLAELTGVSSKLFSPSSSNAMSFSASTIWQQVSIYLIPSCMTGSCGLMNSLGNTSLRTYVYSPSPDVAWKQAWDHLLSDAAFGRLIRASFSFKALPLSLCPYPVMYCVPFPGVTFLDMPGDYCMPQLKSSVSSSLPAASAQALNGIGIASVQRQISESSLVDYAGAIMKSVDCFFVTSFFGFVIGLVFMVLLRWFVGVMTWIAILVILLLLLGAGAVSYIRSGQCADASFLQTGTSLTVAAVTSSQLVTGTALLETYSGNGADYRGFQSYTKTGKACQRWDARYPQNTSWTPKNYPKSGLTSNYCRNPTNASSIWCLTTDPTTKWELCTPIGVLQPACSSGYMVPSATMRQALQVVAYILWALSGVWLLLVLCLMSRIRLAIALNKVAAMFVYQTPFVLLVPIVQTVLGICWISVWMACASYQLSAVPDGYVPTASYATYAEAYGTADTAGACTGMWPAGSVWKDEAGCAMLSGQARCWRCFPPRYVLGGRMAYSIFTLLWNNALMVAVGQCIIAGAVASWFFTPRAAKGSQSSIRAAVWNALRYHFGSMAFGSLILAAVQFIRLVMYYFQKQAEAQKNKVMVLVLKVLGCCMWCVEKCIKFLNKNAYIQVAILGTPFCTSAKNAFFLMLRNALRFAVVASMGSVIYTIGVAFITVMTSASGYLILEALYPNISPIGPVISYVVVGIIIGMLYMNVYGMAVDASLQCFAAAEEMQDVETFVPKPLLNLVPKA